MDNWFAFRQEGGPSIEVNVVSLVNGFIIRVNCDKLFADLPTTLIEWPDIGSLSKRR